MLLLLPLVRRLLQPRMLRSRLALPLLRALTLPQPLPLVVLPPLRLLPRVP